MRIDELKEKALSLPLSPGVYIMKERDENVIYIGKAKKLKNRVSQYFQDTASHSPKTRLMVSKVDHFDVIVAKSEFEALILECSLIKQHLPKYNILLKDDKGFPYLRLNMKDLYPTISVVNKIANDGAGYYGPFGSRGLTNGVLEAVRLALKLPNCSKKFPQGIGKGRPCLHYHMNQCSGWCLSSKTQSEYMAVMEQARQLLLGNFRAVADEIREQMLSAAENLNFELAASLRDRLAAVEALGRKQLVTAGSRADTDVIGYAQTETKACFTVLHFGDGTLLDKEYEIISLPDNRESAVSSLVKQYYFDRGAVPKRIFLPFDIEDRDLFEQLLFQEYNKKVRLMVPERGDNAGMVALAVKNAQEEAERATDQNERINGALSALGKMLAIEPPKRIESFDVSNIAGSDIVASMVVFCDGRPKKSDYKRFKIEDLSDQDDYASMQQAVRRRFTHLLAGDKGFEIAPDVLLIDGGAAHAQVAESVLCELGMSLRVIGMVKDDRHRTRALVTAGGDEVRIDGSPAVFSLIGTIQEETHRFAIQYHRQLRSRRLKYSELDSICGIGPKRKHALLKVFKSITAISVASLTDLERYLPRDAAAAVYNHFKEKRERSEQ